jgi:hypothetical protein
LRRDYETLLKVTLTIVYWNPDIFFDNTYPTAGLRLLLSETLGRLSDAKPANNAIIRLETAFGGGKTHNLIALYHVASGYGPPARFLDADLVLAPGTGMCQILGSGTEFTAVVMATDHMAIGTRHALREHGLRVPEDISVVSMEACNGYLHLSWRICSTRCSEISQAPAMLDTASPST